MKIEPNTPVMKPAAYVKGNEAGTTAQAEASNRSPASSAAPSSVAFSIHTYTVQKGNKTEIMLRDAREGLLLLQTVQAQLRTIRGLLKKAREATLREKPIQPFLDELQRVAHATHYKDIPLLDGSFTAVWIEVSAKRKLEFQTYLLDAANLGAGVKEEPASVHASIAVLAAYMTDIDAIIKKLTVYADMQKKNIMLTGNPEISEEQWNSLRMNMIASQIAAFYFENIQPKFKNEKTMLFLILFFFLFLFIVIYFSVS